MIHGTSLRIYGIEFSADNSKLYVSLHSMSGSSPFGGIYKIVLSSGVSTQLTFNDNYGFTHLELARDGYIYAVNGGSLGIINTSTETVSSAGLSGTIYSDASSMGNSNYRLPDQIDGEDYNYFFGVSKIALDGNVNGSVVSGTTPLLVCSSGSITFNTTSTSVTDYRVRIYNSNSTGSQLSEVGTTPSWTTAALPSAVNLKTPYSNYLDSHTGYYLVILEVKNACAQTSKSALLNVINVPSPTSNFTYTIGGTTNVTPSTTYPGNSACQLSTSVNGNSSSGFVTYYSIEIRQVNCSTGADMGSIGIFNSTNVLNNDPANINGLTVQTIVNSPLYFYNNPNNCYKVIYTVGNPCGSQASVGYFTNNTFCRTGSFDDESSINSATVSPNPTKESTIISFTLEETTPVTLKLMDLKGNEYLILDNEILGSGKYDKDLNLNNLPSGIYIYQLLTDKLKTGKIIKSE